MSMTKEIFSQIQPLSSSQLREADDLFFELRGSIEESETLWQALDTGIASMNAATLYTFRQSYLRWYTILSWDLLLSRSKEVLPRICQTTLVTAVREDIPVWKKFIEYLHSNSLDEDDMQAVYATVRDLLLRSDQIVCYLKGEAVTLETYMVTVSSFEQREDTLGLSQYYSDVQHALVQDAEVVHIEVDAKQMMASIQDFFHFLQGVLPENIFYIVDAHMYPQKYDESFRNAQPAAPITDMVDDMLETAAAVPDLLDTWVAQVSAHKSDIIAWLANDQTQEQLVYACQSLKNPVQARQRLAATFQQVFPDIHEQMDIAGAIVELDSFLQEQGITATNDFLYFDDTDAGFHWHEEYKTP